MPPESRLRLRIITQFDMQLFPQSSEFTFSNPLYTAKFNKLTTEPRGTKLAQEISAYRCGKRR